MNKEEAIICLQGLLENPLINKGSYLAQAIEMAIQALSQEPCDDVRGLSPVTQKSGKWIEHPEIETTAPEYLMFYECSECGDKQCFCKSDIHKKRFCNNCGAKMEVEE